jgi:hypothetical protein
MEKESDGKRFLDGKGMKAEQDRHGTAAFQSRYMIGRILIA